MHSYRGNLPDEIWSRMKHWAKTQAGAQISPTIDECVAAVLHITAEITGRADSLRRDVVSFYANETAEMILQFRENDSATAAFSLIPPDS